MVMCPSLLPASGTPPSARRRCTLDFRRSRPTCSLATLGGCGHLETVRVVQPPHPSQQLHMGLHPPHVDQLLKQSQGGMCIRRTAGIGLRISQERLGP